MTKTEFAEKIGSNANTLRGWFNQTRPLAKRPYRVNMAKLIGLTEQDIEHGLNGPPKATTTRSTSVRLGTNSGPDEDVAKVHYVPILNSISASQMQDRSDAVESVADAERVAVPFESDNAFALVVEGDCMSPRYESGEIVIFEIVEDYRKIQSGRDYAIQYDADLANESTFKRLSVDPKRPSQAIAQCLNPTIRPNAFPIDLRHVSRIGLAIMTVHK